MFGPDSASSITIDEMKEMVDGIRAIERSLNSRYSKPRTVEIDRLRNMFGKSLAVRRNMLAGDIITLNDLESKKPFAKGISADRYVEVIGRRLRKDLMQWAFLKEEDIY